MIPNLYIENGCFTKHPFINVCLGFQEYLKGGVGWLAILFRKTVPFPPVDSVETMSNVAKFRETPGIFQDDWHQEGGESSPTNPFLEFFGDIFWCTVQTFPKKKGWNWTRNFIAVKNIRQIQWSEWLQSVKTFWVTTGVWYPWQTCVVICFGCQNNLVPENKLKKRRLQNIGKKNAAICGWVCFPSSEFSWEKPLWQDMVVAFMEQCREGVRDVWGPLVDLPSSFRCVYLGLLPLPSNSHHREYYVFSRGFICHYYWEEVQPNSSQKKQAWG